jgi:multiple sugar transport system permease protein
MRRLGRRTVAARVGSAIILGGFACFFALPLVWLLLGTTKTYFQLEFSPPLSFGSVNALVAGWNQIVQFQGGVFLSWIANSAEYSFGALILMLVASIPAGYALALSRFRLRRPLLVLTMVTMLTPSTALVLPTFLELNAVGLIGNALSVILPFAFFPFGVYLTQIYFTTSVPKDLLAAARIDGCSEIQVFVRVAIPLAMPIIALVGFFSVVQSWTNYFLPFVMLPSDSGYPVQIGLSLMSRSNLPLATVLSALPIVILFICFQRFLISGKTAGALAGE